MEGPVVKDLPVNSGTHIRSLARELIFHMPGDQKTKMQKKKQYCNKLKTLKIVHIKKRTVLKKKKE